jgi:hypothetical protein
MQREVRRHNYTGLAPVGAVARRADIRHTHLPEARCRQDMVDRRMAVEAEPLMLQAAIRNLAVP